MRTKEHATLPGLALGAITAELLEQPLQVATAGRAEEVTVGLKVLRSFLQALREQAVAYCHWKSNVRLEQSLSGDTDLDLLVSRYHSQLFRQLLYQHNIKPVLAAPGKRYPAVEDYVGFDPESGRSFHLHVHYQLVLGEQFVKNYRLPLETHFLESVRWRQGVAIPAPELEIIVLSLRALLKYRDRDAVKDILNVRYPGVPEHITDEIHDLLGQTTMPQIATTLSEIEHLVPAEVVLEFLTTIVDQPRAGFTFLRLRQHVRRTLNRYQRNDRLQTFVTYFRELWSRRGAFLRFAPQQLMTPVNGGMTMALVGADGAGKSTISKLLRKWLGWKLDVWNFYLGSKQPSFRSQALYVIFRMLRRSHSELSRWLREKHPLARGLARARDTLLAAYHLSIGYDRYARYVLGMRKARAGSIVIFDRFPLESISSDENFRLLDGPQINSEDARAAGWPARKFADAERTLYQQMRPPDYLFVLEVSPEVALQRKPDHEVHTVEAKAQVIGQLVAMDGLGEQGTRVLHINADLPLELLLPQLKAHIWELL